VVFFAARQRREMWRYEAVVLPKAQVASKEKEGAPPRELAAASER
jgi:c-di-GMP-binding flagellar brake protein YcgR